MFMPSDMHVKMSFINITKRRGPRIDPLGTPDRTGSLDDTEPPTTTCCCLPLSYDLINLSIKPSI